jgi:hypothetical protein
MTWIRLSLTAAVVMLLLGAGACCCSKKPHKVAYDPAEQYPEWAYDAPFYYRPASERGDVSEAVPPAAPGCPPHYYTRDRLIYLPRPQRTEPTSMPARAGDPRFSPFDLAPRIAVYWTTTAGLDWRRSGYFGLSQTHYVYEAENDGVYGFRFVGPGIPEAKSYPPGPVVVFHVDTSPPDVVLYVEPNQVQYQVNEQVTVRWTATDQNLADKPSSISVCWESDTTKESAWTVMDKALAAEGAVAVVVPPQAAGQSFMIRITARDKAGNLATATSPAFPVVAESVTSQPAPTTARASGDTNATEVESSSEASFEGPTPVDPGQGGRPLSCNRPALPPLSGDSLVTEGHWSARPWQTLSHDGALRSPSVWSLPVRRLPASNLAFSTDVSQ